MGEKKRLPDPTAATLVVIVYVEGSEPCIETIRPVKEQRAWKVANYPFVGIRVERRPFVLLISRTMI